MMKSFLWEKDDFDLTTRDREEKRKLVALYVEKLAACNAETDTLRVFLEAQKDGLITKKVLDDILSVTPISGRRRTVIQNTVQSRFEAFRVEIEKLVACNAESELLTLVIEAEREGFIEQNVRDHFTSLNDQIPTSMKCRYLIACVHKNLKEKLAKHTTDCNTVLPYNVPVTKTNALDVPQMALNDGFIDQVKFDYFISLYPKGPSMMSRRTYEHVHKKLKLNLTSRLPKDSAISLGDPPKLKTVYERGDFLLSSNNIAKLTDFLINYSYKWRAIGVALGFQPQDLDNIEASPLLLHAAPQSFLSRLLEDWLQKKFGHLLLPSVNNLTAALRSQAVGLGLLADTLKNTFPNFSIQQTDIIVKPSYYLFNISSSTKSWKTVNIYVEENASTLIEVQMNSAQVTYEYNWLKDNSVVPNDIPFLCLHKASIDCDGTEYSCNVAKKIFDKCPSVREVNGPVTARLNVSCTLDQFRNSLASMYLNQPEVPEDTWPPGANKNFVNLALITQQKVNYNSDYARLTIRGDIDDILQHKQIIKDTNFYNSFKSGKVLFVEGRPGSGKTTFVHKITRDWATKTGGVIRLLLLVSLRVLNTIKNPDLSDILKLFKDLKVSQKLIEDRNGKGVCFIFDGFDEYSPLSEEDSIIHKLISKTYLNQSTVIVASRPAAIARLRQRADEVIEVLGFRSDQIHEYFDCYPFSSHTKSAELKVYLESHPNILHMCYLPIHAAMVAFLFEVTGKIPKTETEMYTHFTRFTLMRTFSKHKMVKDVNIFNLIGEEQCFFQQICQLAFEKTLSNKQVMNQDEVRAYFQDSESDVDISLGLIAIDRTAGLYGYKNFYTFLHLTFQEYLAACYLSSLEDNKQVELLLTHGEKNHMLVVWKFFFGLVTVKAFDNKFKSILQKTKGHILFHIQCAYESQQTIVCAQFLKSVHYHIHIANKFLSIPDFTAIGYVTSTTLLSTKLSLINCDVDSEAVHAILSKMEDRARDSLHGLHIEMEIVNAVYVQKLLANLTSLRHIFIKSRNKEIDYQCDDVEAIRSQLTNVIELSITKIDIRKVLFLGDLTFTQLEVLNLEGSLAGSREVRELAAGLKHCNSLKYLNVSCNDIDRNGAGLLATGLGGCKTLERIDISNNSIPPCEVSLILYNVKNCYLEVVPDKIITQVNEGYGIVNNEKLLRMVLGWFCNLQSLQISLGQRYAGSFRDRMRQWSRLRELRVSLEEPYNMVVTKAVCSCLGSSLKVLGLKYSIVATESAEILRKGLQQCPNLQTLDLDDNLIGHGEIEVLAPSFLHLKQLHLNHNCIGDKSAHILSSYFNRWHCLEALSLGSNGIQQVGGMALAFELSHCTNLQMLDLKGNELSEAACSKIASVLNHLPKFQTLCLS